MFISKLHNTQSKFSGKELSSYENPLHQKDGEQVNISTVFRTESGKVQDLMLKIRNREQTLKVDSSSEGQVSKEINPSDLDYLSPRDLIACYKENCAYQGNDSDRANCNYNREMVIRFIIKDCEYPGRKITFKGNVDKTQNFSEVDRNMYNIGKFEIVKDKSN